ncbi:AAA family ATPase [Sphaerotilaceae bacterium SBD11-9]
MGEPKKVGDTPDFEADFVNLARLAASESYDDVRMLLGKMVRKYRTNRPALAEQINQMLRVSQTRSATPPSMLRRGPALSEEALPVDADSRMSLIRVFDDCNGLEPPILPQGLFGQIEAIVHERREREKLAAEGIHPTRSAILIGPPGVGKTLSARWIAAQIGKPLWVLDLTTVMSSLLGKTGNNLRMVFDHARTHQAVLLLDEIDSIAKRRSDESDVGELKRLVTAILQEVDSWPDTGLLLAATNHPELVDPALWRRFDAILTFEPSDPTSIEAAVRRFLGSSLAQFESVVPLLAESLHGHSLSDVERAVAAVRRTTVLKGIEPVLGVVEVTAPYVAKLDKPARQRLAFDLASTHNMSHNKITTLTGVSRDTIRKHVGPSPMKGRGIKKEI